MDHFMNQDSLEQILVPYHRCTDTDPINGFTILILLTVILTECTLVFGKKKEFTLAEHS